MTQTAPQGRSRYDVVTRVVDADGVTSLGMRAPLRFDPVLVHTRHRVVDGDTWHSLAERYLAGLPDPAQYWALLAEFQPTPIVDPTVALRVGSWVFLPNRAALRGVLAVL